MERLVAFEKQHSIDIFDATWHNVQQPKEPEVIKAWVITKKGKSFEVLLPSMRAVCPGCNGDGTELRGGLKGCVISDESLSDPDFRQSYFGGDYDVACSECKGLRVVDVVDEDRLTPKMKDRYFRAVDEANQAEAECAAERRFFERSWPEY